MDDFLKPKRILTYNKGEMVISQGEIARRAYVVKEGLVKVYNLSDMGQERLIDFKTSQDLLPGEWVFSKAPYSLYFYEALTPTYLYAVEREELMQAIDQNPTVRSAILDRYVIMNTEQNIRVDALTYSSARDKLLHMLQFLCLRFGKPGIGDSVELRYYMNHQLLSDLLGVSRETTTKEVLKLKHEGVVKYDRKRMAVHLPKLLELIGSDEYNELARFR
jgi:CRP-like cAMP-binding protein